MAQVVEPDPLDARRVRPPAAARRDSPARSSSAGRAAPRRSPAVRGREPAPADRVGADDAEFFGHVRARGRARSIGSGAFMRVPAAPAARRCGAHRAASRVHIVHAVGRRARAMSVFELVKVLEVRRKHREPVRVSSRVVGALACSDSTRSTARG